MSLCSWIGRHSLTLGLSSVSFLANLLLIQVSVVICYLFVSLKTKFYRQIYNFFLPCHEIPDFYVSKKATG